MRYGRQLLASRVFESLITNRKPRTRYEQIFLFLKIEEKDERQLQQNEVARKPVVMISKQ